MAKKINLEELKMENLKKAIKDIDSISDTYQRTHLRLMLVQTINSMNTGVVNLPEGREALDNTKTKTNNTASQEALETVANVKEALKSVVDGPQDTIVDPEIAPIEATGVDVNELNNQEDMIAESNLGRDEEIVQAEMEEAMRGDAIAIGTQVESLEFDPGDGNLIDIAPQYNALAKLPDDDNKQILAYYLAVYDEESVSQIVSAFSVSIESNPYELLNEDNYIAFLEYFNECLQG